MNTEQLIADVGVNFSVDSFKENKGVQGLKYYLILMALRCRMDIARRISTSLSQLIVDCGLRPNYKDEILGPFRNTLAVLEESGKIKSDVLDWITLSPKKLFNIEVSIKDSPFYLDQVYNGFVTLLASEFFAIAGSNATVSPAIMVGVFLFLKSFKQPAYPSKNTIMTNLGLSNSSIDRALKALQDLNLIYIRNDFWIEDSVDRGFYVYARAAYSIDSKLLEDPYKVAKYMSVNVYEGRKVIPECDVPKGRKKIMFRGVTSDDNLLKYAYGDVVRVTSDVKPDEEGASSSDSRYANLPTRDEEMAMLETQYRLAQERAAQREQSQPQYDEDYEMSLFGDQAW